MTTPVFDKIDPATKTRIGIPVSGDDMGHVLAMTFGPDGNFLVSATFDAPYFEQNETIGRFFRLTPDGVATQLGSMNHISKGIAFVPPFTPSGLFNDVPTNYWAFSSIETLRISGITAGCGGGNYCPEDSVTRAQMAVFLERGTRGSGFSPSAVTGNTFLDVGASDFATAFIEQFLLDGITSGCGGHNYCPNDAVTRAQMAVFLLRAEHGAGYTPPAPTGVFGDVDLAYWAVGWIDQLAAEGITSGCGGGNYCPDDPVTRAQMAVFLVRTFGL